MTDNTGSEYDRLFYPFLFDGGTASVEDVLAQVQHSTLEKCATVLTLRRATLAAYRDHIVAAGTAMAHAFQSGATLFAFGNGGSTTDAQDIVADLTYPTVAWRSSPAGDEPDERCRSRHCSRQRCRL